MKVLVDATSIIDQPTGAGRYSYNILKNISKIDNHNQYTIIVQKKLKETHPIFNCPNSNFIRMNIGVIGIKRDILLSFFLFFSRKKFDIFYCLMPYLPVFYSLKKSIITIHDLGYFRYPEYLNKLSFFYLKFIIKRAIKKSVSIITSSETSQNEIITLFNVSDKKIKRVYGDSTFSESDYLRNKKNIFDFPYFLYVGERRPHKNLENLIRAFALFKKNNLSEIKLILVGKDYKNHTKKLEDLVNNLDLKENVVILNSIDEESLYSYYCYASALLFVSFYEGFGLPLVEAIKLRIPIIASDIPVMKEVAGESALFVSPNNINDIAEKMKIFIESDSIKKELINKSETRALMFSWEKSAREILLILNNNA